MTVIGLAFVAFINLFVVPNIGVFIFYRRYKKEFKFSMEWCCWYAVFNVLNYLMSQIFVKIIDKLCHIVIQIEMSKYTVIALAMCVILPFLIEAVDKYFQVKVVVSLRESKEKKKIKRQEKKDER